MRNNSKCVPFTDVEDRILQKLYMEKTCSQIGDLLGRSRDSIRTRMKRLGLVGGRRHLSGLGSAGRTRFNQWSEAEDDILKAQWQHLSNEVIGNKLGRTAMAVRLRKHALGLKRTGTVRFSDFVPKPPSREAINWAVAHFNDPDPYVQMEARMIAGQLI